MNKQFIMAACLIFSVSALASSGGRSAKTHEKTQEKRAQRLYEAKIEKMLSKLEAEEEKMNKVCERSARGLLVFKESVELFGPGRYESTSRLFKEWADTLSTDSDYVYEHNNEELACSLASQVFFLRASALLDKFISDNKIFIFEKESAVALNYYKNTTSYFIKKYWGLFNQIKSEYIENLKSYYQSDLRK